MEKKRKRGSPGGVVSSETPLLPYYDSTQEKRRRTTGRSQNGPFSLLSPIFP